MSKRDHGNRTLRHQDSAASILIVEEHTGIRTFMSTILRSQGYSVEEAPDGRRALESVSKNHLDLVITDLALSDLDAAEVLQTTKRMAPETEVVVMTSVNTIDQSLALTRDGAYDLLVKPFQPDQLILVAHRALERQSLQKKARRLEETIRGRDPFEGIVGASRSLTDVLKLVERIARLDNAVLITGERGTGKELIARTVHALSPRREKPFIVVDCHAIPDGRPEAELLGADGSRGIGPSLAKPGLLDSAHGGTVFLDDVAELSPLSQENTLRFLRNGETRSSRGRASTDLDVRVIAATNRDLEKCVEQGVFNEDLYYRLNVVSIRMPPLRERIEDIPLLAQHFLRKAASKLHSGQRAISPRAMSALTGHPWPGNVRELESVVEQAVALDRDGILGLDDLPFSDAPQAADRIIDRAKSDCLTLSELEREYILEILTQCGGIRKKTAEKLGITTATLWRKLKRFEKDG